MSNLGKLKDVPLDLVKPVDHNKGVDEDRLYLLVHANKHDRTILSGSTVNRFYKYSRGKVYAISDVFSRIKKLGEQAHLAAQEHVRHLVGEHKITTDPDYRYFRPQDHHLETEHEQSNPRDTKTI